MSRLSANASLSHVEHALTAITRVAGQPGVERLGAAAFQLAAGSRSDAARLGRRIAERQLDSLVEGGVASRQLIGIFHDGSTIAASLVGRAGGAHPLRAGELVGLGARESGTPQVLERGVALHGLVASGRWIPLG